MRSITKNLPEMPCSIPWRTVFLTLAPFLSAFAVHYISSNLYAHFCTPLSLWGLFQSLVLTASPVCVALLTVMNNSNSSYALLVTGIVTGLLAKLALPTQS